MRSDLGRLSSCLAAAFLAGMLGTAPAAAAVNVDVGVLWNPNPSNDSQVYLHLSNVTYPMPREEVMEVFPTLRDPYADYPVLAFIASSSRVSMGTVWRFRRAGHSWFETMLHFGVQPDYLFIELPTPPGPPYGKAYGHWRKDHYGVSPKNVTDADVQYWVGLRTAARYYGAGASMVAEWNKAGKRPAELAATRYRQKHGADRGVKQAGIGSAKGSGKGKGKKSGNR